MKRCFSLICCAGVLALSLGCGGKKELPAVENEPMTNEDEITNKYEDSVPDDAKEERKKMGYGQ